MNSESRYVEIAHGMYKLHQNDVKLSDAQRKVIVDAGVKLMLQGIQSYNDEKDVCLYRHEVDGKNLCCAIGHMIKDEHHNLNLESKAACSADVIEAVALSIGDDLVDAKMAYVMKELQRCHDSIGDSAEHVVDYVVKLNVSRIGVFDNNNFRTSFIQQVGQRFKDIDKTLYVDILNEYNKQGRLPAETTGENNV